MDAMGVGAERTVPFLVTPEMSPKALVQSWAAVLGFTY